MLLIWQKPKHEQRLTKCKLNRKKLPFLDLELDPQGSALWQTSRIRIRREDTNQDSGHFAIKSAENLI